MEFSPVFFGLFCMLFSFSMIYNCIVSWLGERKRGFLWLLVIIGTLVTLGGAIPEVGFEVVVKITILFGAAGAPMAAGDIWRYWKELDKEKRDRDAELVRLDEIVKRLLEGHDDK